MFITIDPNDRRPIYQQVADAIKSLIARGELSAGTQLPPVRQIAADLAVNLNTIAAAYRELQADGLITVKHGSGAVVAPLNQPQKKPDAEELRKPLRNALTELILAGLPKRAVLKIVVEELGGLTRAK